jgi:hypothetical protein
MEKSFSSYLHKSLLNRHCFGKSEEKKISTTIEGLALSSKKRCNLKKPIIAQNIVFGGNLASHLDEINKYKT